MDSVTRFINYAKIDTQASEDTHTTPSTEKQKNLGKLLVQELIELGLNDAYMDEYGNVYAHLKGEGDKIGLNAHMDTALEVTDTNVNPRVVKNWNGSDIKLNDIYKLSKNDFPSLNKHIGKDLVVTDGNTLLGADDKAGIAIIMQALQFFKEHPEVKHHNISVCFTVDEEIGEGPLHFSTTKMDADYAFTLDGGDIDCINIENFNADACHVTFQGVAVHPGEGKNALINALLLANEFINELPQKETPFDADIGEGYWHLNSIEGSSDYCELDMILREFDKDKLLNRKSHIQAIVNGLNKKYKGVDVNVTFRYQYENMKPFVDKDPRPLEKAMKALRNNGLEPKITQIRGGTDGASFSKMGLVTPNLGTGSTNHHGRFEYLVVQDFNIMIDIVVDILKL